MKSKKSNPNGRELKAPDAPAKLAIVGIIFTTGAIALILKGLS